MKKLVMAAGILGGLVLGDYTQPVHEIAESVRYYNVPIAEHFPNDPWNYRVQRELIEQDGKTYQALYLVNEEQGIHKKINEEGCTCGLENAIDDFMYESKQWLDKTIKKGKEYFNASKD